MSVQYVSGSAIDYLDTPAAPAAQDFWRTPTTAGALPDGVSDVTEAIARTGLTGVGSFLAAPVAQLDVAFGARSGGDGRVVGVTPFYVTGTLPTMGWSATPGVTPVGGVEFRHSNQSQGIGFAYDGIYATGSAASHSIGIRNRGTGQIWFEHQTLNGGFNYTERVGAAITVNQGWQDRFFAGGTQVMTEFHRQANFGVGGTLGMETYWQRTDASGIFRNAMQLAPSVTDAQAFSLTIDSNILNDAKLVLWGIQSTAFFGFGVKAGTLAYFINSNVGHHRWYVGPSPGTQIMGLSGLGNLTIDPLGTGAGNNTSPLIRFGSEGSGEQISSNRVTAGRFLNGLEFTTGAVRRGAFLASGRFYLATVPVFASDGAAGAGGLLTGEVYKDALGILHIKA